MNNHQKAIVRWISNTPYLVQGLSVDDFYHAYLEQFSNEPTLSRNALAAFLYSQNIKIKVKIIHNQKQWSYTKSAIKTLTFD